MSYVTLLQCAEQYYCLLSENISIPVPHSYETSTLKDRTIF